MRLERAEWGTDLPSVESQLETQRHIHASVEDLGSSVKEARVYEVWPPTWGLRDQILWVTSLGQR